MPKTVVALFENAARADDAVREMEARGIPRKEVHTLREPATFAVTGVMSFPRLDFETDVTRELTRIGATEAEAQSFLEGLRRGGALCFATGSDEDIETAATIMNRHGASQTEQVEGTEPHLPTVAHHSVATPHSGGVFAGRIRQSGDSACVFVW